MYLLTRVYEDTHAYICIYIQDFKARYASPFNLGPYSQSSQKCCGQKKCSSAMEAFSLAAKGNCKQMRRIAGSISISTSSCL